MKLLETSYFKGRDGYQAETLTDTDANGNVWEIRTSKRSGKVYCYAHQGQDQGNGMISYDLFGGKQLEDLAEEAGQCNEAKVKRVHEAGLIMFQKHFDFIPEMIVEAYILSPGQIIFHEWQADRERLVIFETIRPGHFKAVTLDGQKFENVDRIRPYNEKFGIGTYYNEGDRLPMEEVNNLVNQARQAEADRETKRSAESMKANQERARKIEEGKQIISEIPAGIENVIIAELHECTSDMQSDYHGHDTKEIIYLAWSAHNKDLFPEMRKAADKFEGTQHLGTGKDGEIEHREKYSMGSGYYLKDGHSDATGWSVSKSSLGQYGPTLETLQIAAAEGRFFCNVEQPAQIEATAPQYEAPAGTVQIIEHPLRAHKILVIGDTKPIKETLKTIKGAWWNRFEKGWEFKREQIAEIEAALKSLRKPQAEPTPDPEEIEDLTPEDMEENRREFEYEEDAAKEEETPALYWSPERIQAEKNAAKNTVSCQEYEPKHEAAPEPAKAKQEFCRPAPAPAFFRENGCTTAAEQRAQANSLKLYSETQQGTNTGRAQQGFLF